MKSIAEGAVAPDFELPDENGVPRRLSTLLQDGPVVLFAYPAAMSSGCTAEACSFRDLAAEFAAVGAQRIGISTDPVARQKAFVESSRLDYPLLSDEDGAVATSLGIKRKFLTPVKRVTLIIGTDRTVLKVIASEFSMAVHADESLAFLKARAAA